MEDNNEHENSSNVIGYVVTIIICAIVMYTIYKIVK